MLRLTDIFEKNGRIPWHPVEEQAVLLDQDEGELFRLTPVGAAIWEVLDGQRTVLDVIASVQEVFDVSPATAKKDVISFLKQLRRYGLIEPKPVPAMEKGNRQHAM